MPVLRLESYAAIPPNFQQRLQLYDTVFKKFEFIDQVLAAPGMADLISDLEGFVRAQTVQAYHCTREPSPGFFEAHGLRLTNLSDHQAEFLESHGHHFTQAERETVEAEWDRQFHRKTGSSGVRNGLIWMCLSRPGVPHDGTDKFFTYFGGEAIYWPFVSGQHPTIAAKLQSIGQPVVVELAVPAKDLHCFQPLAHYVLSCHHKTLNPNIGIAAISGVLPNSHAKNAEIPPVAALATTTQPLPASTQQVPGFELAVPNANPSIPTIRCVKLHCSIQIRHIVRILVIPESARTFVNLI